MYSINLISYFRRDIKKLLKKYPNIHKNCLPLLDQLEKGVFEGDKLQGFDNKMFKARVGSSDQKKGKRGGFRVIYYVSAPKKIVYLFSIYAKAKQENIAKSKIEKILQSLKETENL